MSISKVLLVSLASTLFVHQAQADQKRFIFDIRNQSLSQALLRLAQMTGIQLLYISDIAQNVRAPSLIGIYSAEEALPILLQDSNLEAIFINENTIIVKGPTPQDDAQIAALGLSDNFGDHDVDVIQDYQEITGADRYKFMEEIITTGQLVKYPDFHSSSPTIALHYQNFSSNGDLTNDEILNVLPQIIPHATPNTNNSGTNDGSSTVNLRHLGISRTLVLLNGRRLPGANMSGYADISMIPSSLIDRIDIVTGGASAIYGSGAIAGVVNFIHDNHAKGLNVRAQAGISELGDAEQFSLSTAYGQSFANDNGHFSLFAEYNKRGSYTEGDRDISKNSTHVSNGKIVETGANTVPGGRYTYSGTSKDVSPDAISPDLLPWFQENFPVKDNGDIIVNRLIRFTPDGKPLPFIFEDHNIILSDYIYLQNPYQRASFFGFADYQIAEDLTFFSEVSYTYSYHDRLLAPYSLSNLYISESHPNISPEFAEVVRLLEGEDPDNRIRVRTRIPEGGSRRYTQNRHYGRLVSGLKGQLSAAWDFEGYINYGLLRRQRIHRNGYSRINLQNALGCPISSSDTNLYPDDCPEELLFPDGVRINPFGAGNISDEEIKYLQGTPLISHVKTDQLSAAFHLTGTVNHFLAATPILIATGLEYRYEKASRDVDPRLGTGEMIGFNEEIGYTGSFNVQEAFAEVGIPLLANRPFFHKLDFTGGVRLSHYSTAGNVLAWRVGLNWKIIEGLRLRGEFQRAVRAPSIHELYRKSAEGFPDFIDPCAGAIGEVEIFCHDLGVADVSQLRTGQHQVSSFSSGNIELQEEVSNTYTAGIMWNPSVIPNLILSADYYDISLDNSISPPSPTDVANLCIASRDVTSLHCQSVTRDSRGRVTRIDRQYDNLLINRRTGIDLEINFGFKLEEIGFKPNSGSIDMRLMGGWILSSEDQASQNAPLIDCAGYVDDALCGRAIPEFKSIFWLTYKQKNLQTTLRWRWLSRLTDGILLHDPTAQPVIPHVAPYHYFDLLGNYKVSHNLEVYGGIRNLTDKQPPLIESEVGAGTDPATYDTRGRFFFLGINKSF
ncbi:TonB-dependent receptor [Paremcibacter congregatus]|uniref:TonB-dependent receptor n=1 Tax=Paremcibacter congregatus TaxID=2043170 RepID=UPI0013FE1117|nr:TonB-dependent receptor [Paremcibacter congregatus]